MEQLLIIRTV